MLAFWFARKRVFSSLFLFLFSCIACSPPCHQWQIAIIKAYCPPATYVKTYLPATNTFSGMEVELMCHNGCLNLYLNAITLQFPTTNPKQTELKIVVCDQTYIFLAERLNGGQRLLLPDDAKQLVICSLLEENCVKIYAGRYETTVTDEGFAKTYNDLVRACYPTSFQSLQSTDQQTTVDCG